MHNHVLEIVDCTLVVLKFRGHQDAFSFNSLLVPWCHAGMKGNKTCKVVGKQIAIDKT